MPGATATDNCGDVTWYNNYECAIEEGDFKVYNQGAGSNAGYGDSGSSPASDYLDANFASVFPEGHYHRLCRREQVGVYHSRCCRRIPAMHRKCSGFGPDRQYA